jgi:hypothetical protein
MGQPGGRPGGRPVGLSGRYCQVVALQRFPRVSQADSLPPQGQDDNNNDHDDNDRPDTDIHG